jgi:multiple RNA-binding domain-containing protein 1
MSDTTATPAPTKPTSRVCVKNLPAYVSDDRLRALFAAQADVTDVKIMRTRYGESRKFGFVGFRTPEAAAKALQYFNKSFLDTARLHVEFAMPVGSTDLSRPWSKYSEGSSRHSFIHRDKDADKSGRQGESSAAAEPETELEKNVARISEDAALREFLAVKKPRAQAKVWANDDEQGLVGNVVRLSISSQQH